MLSKEVEGEWLLDGCYNFWNDSALAFYMHFYGLQLVWSKVFSGKRGRILLEIIGYLGRSELFFLLELVKQPLFSSLIAIFFFNSSFSTVYFWIISSFSLIFFLTNSI
jgi:hypothetical protein